MVTQLPGQAFVLTVPACGTNIGVLPGERGVVIIDPVPGQSLLPAQDKQVQHYRASDHHPSQMRKPIPGITLNMRCYRAIKPVQWWTSLLPCPPSSCYVQALLAKEAG